MLGSVLENPNSFKISLIHFIPNLIQRKFFLKNYFLPSLNKSRKVSILVFLVVWILFNCYVLNIIIHTLNNTSFLYLVLFLFFLYLFPSLGNTKVRGKKKMHTDLLLRYVNAGKVDQDSLGALNQTDFFFLNRNMVGGLHCHSAI